MVHQQANIKPSPIKFPMLINKLQENEDNMKNNQK